MANCDQYAIILLLVQVILHFTEALDGGVIGNAEMPEDCMDMKYCTDPGDIYPSEAVEKLVKESLTSMVHEMMEKNNIAHRYGPTNDEITCKYEREISKVYYIVDKDGQTRVVIQKKGTFDQEFELNVCTPEGPVTYDIGPITPPAAEKLGLTCDQEYMNYDFYVLSKDFNSIEKVQMEKGLPVWCACKYGNAKISDLYVN